MKTIIDNVLAGYKPVKQAILALLLILTIAGCKKDNNLLPAPDADGSTIKFVLSDNFNFSVEYLALTYIGLQDTLAKPGPYTFLAPDNNAFLLVNINTQYPINNDSFYDFGKPRLQDMVQYSIIHGLVSLNKLPLTQNKPYRTLTGGNIYVSKYMNGNDTITTINGLKLSSMDNPASNGLIQVLPQVINPEVYLNAVKYIQADTTLSLFAAAVQRAKLDVSLLAGTDEYTLLAPSNAAFQQSGKLGRNLGISTLDSILIADPDKLATLLKYHITNGRYFEGDLYRYAAANPTGITMLDGGKVVIGGNPAGYQAITFLGSGSGGIASGIAKPAGFHPAANNVSIPCGNGVIHIINRVLIP